MGCYFLLQGIFLTQGLNLHWQMASLLLVPPGKPKYSIELTRNVCLGFSVASFFFFPLSIYLFIWLCWVLVGGCGL